MIRPKFWDLIFNTYDIKFTGLSHELKLLHCLRLYIILWYDPLREFLYILCSLLACSEWHQRYKTAVAVPSPPYASVRQAMTVLVPVVRSKVDFKGALAVHRSSKHGHIFAINGSMKELALIFIRLLPLRELQFPPFSKISPKGQLDELVQLSVVCYSWSSCRVIKIAWTLRSLWINTIKTFQDDDSLKYCRCCFGRSGKENSW